MKFHISFFSLVLLFSLVSLLFSCSQGNYRYKSEMKTIDSKIIDIEPFSGISLNIHADVYLSQGETHNVRIEAEEDVKNKIITEVEDNVLIIKCDKSLHSSKDINIYITMKELKLIEVNGSGDIVCQDSFNTDNIAIEINGSGDISLSGRAENQAIEINGSGDIKSFGMLSTNCAIDIRGSGDCEVNVENSLVVSISGSGDVIYKGSPVIETEIDGSGSVKKY
ncbi:MAG: DUF2807 domain-containing protein [Ignavibacteria bacterium]|nr:DUF2807 domain-containing protein [Ignavibacteria bacterium]